MIIRCLAVVLALSALVACSSSSTRSVDPSTSDNKTSETKHQDGQTGPRKKVVCTRESQLGSNIPQIQCHTVVLTE